MLAPDRSTTAGRRKSFQRGRSVTPEDLEDQIDIEGQINCNGNEDIQIVQVHKGTILRSINLQIDIRNKISHKIKLNIWVSLMLKYNFKQVN